MVDSVLPIKGYNAIPMKMDSNGICPQSLRQVCILMSQTRSAIIVHDSICMICLADTEGASSNRAAAKGHVYSALWSQPHRLVSALKSFSCICCIAASTCWLAAGTVTSYDRKREIYQVCREYNITIIEDDAYYYLQYPSLDGMYASH